MEKFSFLHNNSNFKMKRIKYKILLKKLKKKTLTGILVGNLVLIPQTSSFLVPENDSIRSHHHNKKNTCLKIFFA